MTALEAKPRHPMRAVRPLAVDMRQAVADSDQTASLTRRLARGDEAAFHDFHQEYFHRLYSFLLVLTRGQEHAAQEVVQETLLRVARYVHPFESEEVFWSWLKMVARSAARDAARKQRRYLALLERFTLAWRAVPVDDGSGERWLRETVADVLEKLEPEDRSLIEEKYLAGASVREIAAGKGTTEKAVESRLLRLRRRLRAQLFNRLNAP
jgi:RNA polymerase sigma-70 factor, ECF subfamily